MISDWDFNWQDSYRYQKPFVLPKGTVVTAEFTWDNTDANPRNPHSPPKKIVWGEGSTDEVDRRDNTAKKKQQRQTPP